jgi:hypothetical protein
MGLVVVHEGSHSVKRVMNNAANVWTADLGQRLRNQIAAGNTDAVALLEDVERARYEGQAKRAERTHEPGKLASWKEAKRLRREL